MKAARIAHMKKDWIPALVPDQPGIGRDDGGSGVFLDRGEGKRDAVDAEFERF